jgi:putative iron-regulated protein
MGARVELGLPFGAADERQRAAAHARRAPSSAGARRALAGALLAGALLGACEKHPPRADLDAARRAFLRTYADIATSAYADAAAAAGQLERAVGDFVAHPSAAGLDRARQTWRAARVPYLQTEPYRFYDGPIDRVEGLINAWPVDEGFIEAVVVDDLGVHPVLSADLLAALNESEGETSISTGFHAIEYLLWGADRSEQGPGAQSFEEFLTSARASRRRGEYLRLACALLARNLSEVAAAWSERPGSYRATFLALPPDRALGLALKGLGTLAGPELEGERLTVAYETKDQEHEHSCFSDNTRDDLLLDGQGIRNLVLGRYERAAGAPLIGTGLRAVVAAADPALATRLTEAVEASASALRAIPAPFDQAILGQDGRSGRQAIRRAIAAARAQADRFADVVRALGLPLTL